MNRRFVQRILSITSVLVISLTTWAQQSLNVTGDEVRGTNGSVSLSIGEVVFSTAIASSGSVVQGIQHPYRIVTVGVDKEARDIGLDVYPNPATSHLIIKVSHAYAQQMIYELVDADGKTIESNALLHDRTELDVNSIQSAFFFLRISSASKVLQSFKIIKKDHL
jgi:hypothetical protein